MVSKDYYYELRYVDDTTEVTHKFSAEITIEELANQLKDFLKGCSWYEEQVNKLINGGD